MFLCPESKKFLDSSRFAIVLPYCSNPRGTIQPVSRLFYRIVPIHAVRFNPFLDCSTVGQKVPSSASLDNFSIMEGQKVPFECQFGQFFYRGITKHKTQVFFECHLGQFFYRGRTKSSQFNASLDNFSTVEGQKVPLSSFYFRLRFKPFLDCSTVFSLTIQAVSRLFYRIFAYDSRRFKHNRERPHNHKVNMTKINKAGYDPRRSKVSDTTMDDFRLGQLTGKLREVPGIGPKAEKNLKEKRNITNTFQLLGHYMSMATIEDGKIDTFLLNQDFWMFLEGCKISSHRSAIVKAISEKVAASFPQFADLNIYDDEIP